MKQESIALKTMAIKARVFNIIRKDLWKKTNPKSDQFDSHIVAFGAENVMDDKKKIVLFDKWFTIEMKASRELRNFKSKRKNKSEVEKIREENGYYKKKLAKKTSRMNPLKRVK